MSNEATKLGATLAVLTRYGLPIVQTAIRACRQGKATPEQQRIAIEFFDAATQG